MSLNYMTTKEFLKVIEGIGLKTAESSNNRYLSRWTPVRNYK